MHTILLGVREFFRVGWRGTSDSRPRMVQMPRPDGLGDEFVLANTAQTLTKKTIDGNENTLLNLPGGDGSGDVVGPASAVDDRIATFNGTTGKLIQDGGKTIATMDSATALVQTNLTDHEADTANPHAVTAAQAGAPTEAEFDDHSARHQDGGADEISVTGLSGLLADDQHVLDAEVEAAINADADHGSTAPHALAINAQTGTTYTLALTDNGKLVDLENAAAITLTVPPNSAVAFPTGSKVLLRQKGAGAVTVAPGSGVTLQAPNSELTTRAQHSVGAVVKVAGDVWVAVGDLEA